jgi:uncharacterized protein (TIGR02757 family)
MSDDEIKDFLEEKFLQYNQIDFIESDPIFVPHLFDSKEDIEIAGFLTATIAWGQRISIINNARRLVDMMPGGPFHFLQYADSKDFEPFINFVHRTFNGLDCIFFLKALKRIYLEHGGLENVFSKGYYDNGSIFGALQYFRKTFLGDEGPGHPSKHVSDVLSNSAAKRLNMYLRWMIRSDKAGVDFGIWKGIPTSHLMIPLDVHTGNTARKLGILVRKQNDWKAVEALTSLLRQFDPDDPVKYDYALFGLGIFEKF